ncbi:MAG: hypothetical protein STSR0009_29570 [Methanoregula sp.]
MTEKIRVLYVDDEQYLLDLGKVFLERSGNFVVTTSTGAPEALRMLELARFDAIISDYQMPEMDGIEFLKVIRGRGDTTPFIIFTGKGREEVVIEALNSGADHYIQKGGEPKSQFAELEHKIRRAVEHQRDETSLQKSQVQLSEAMDLAHIVNWEFDVASGIFTFNDRFYALYGTTAEREGGYQMPADVYAREFVHPDERGLVADEVQNAIHATDPDYTRQIEHRIIRRDGEIRHIIVRFGITKDARGSTVKTHGANQDITDRKRAEESLQKSEERYRAIVEDQTEFVCRFTPDGRLTFVNDSYCRYFRLDKSRCLGNSHIVKLTPEDARMMKQHLSSLTPQNPVAAIEHRIIMPSGEVRWQRWNDRAIFSGNSNVVEYQSVGRDITEIKNAENSLREREAYYRAIFENTGTASVIIEEDTTISLANEEFVNLCGYSREDIEGKKCWTDFVVQEDREHMLAQHRLRRIDQKKAKRHYEFRFVRKSGEIRTIYLSIDVIPGTKKSIAALLDITELKRAEDALRESEERFHVLFEQSPIPYQSLNADGRFLEANDAWLKSLGYTREEVIGHWFGEFLAPEQVELFRQRLPIFKQVGRVNNVEFLMQRKDGSMILASFDGKIGHHPDGSFRQTHCVWRDITEQRHAEEALRISEEKFRNVFDWANDAILLHTMTVEGSPGRFIEVNQVACRMLGYSKEELLSMGPVDIVPLTLHPQLGDIIRQAQTKDSFLIESQVLRKDGTTVPVESSIHFVNYKGKRIWISHIRDITERKQAETELARVNRALRMLTDSNQALVHNTDEALLMNEICRIAVEVGSYRMAWIGFAEQDEAKTVRPVAHAGFESGYIESAHITWADSERGRGPGGTAIRTGQLSMARNISMDPAFAPWRADAIVRGYQSVIVLPLNGEGRTFGALAIYAREPDAFNTEEVEILKELAGDLAFGIIALRTRVKRDQAEETIRDLNAYNRSLIEASPDPLVTINDNGRISDVNIATEQATGYSRDELIGTDFSYYFTKPEKAKEGYLRGFTDGTVRDYPLEIRHKDGHITPVQYNATVYRDKDGNVRGVFAAARDVTERNKAEEALRESEEKYRTLAANLPEIVYRVYLKGNGRMQFFNDQVVALTGYTEPELIQGTVCSIEPLIHADDRQRVVTAVEKAIMEGGIFTAEYRLIHKDGSIRHFIERGHIIDGEDATPLYIDGMIYDVTERKKIEDALRKSKEQYRSLLENVPELILVHRNGIILYTNPAAVKSLGYQPHEALHKKITDFIAPEFHERVADAVRRRREGIRVEPYEIDVLSRDGDRRTMVINGTQIDLEGGPASLIVLVDITEQKALHDAVMLANKKLNLLASITRHDILNQLLALDGYLELSQDPLDDPQKLSEFVKKAQQAAATIEKQITFTRDYQEMGVNAPGWQNVKAGIAQAQERLPLKDVSISVDSRDLEIFGRVTRSAKIRVVS